MKSIRFSIALAAVAAGVGAAWIELTSDIVGDNVPTAAIALLVGWSYVGCGLFAWRQRPANPLGPVMLATGFAWFATFLGAWQQALPFTVGYVFQNLYLVGFVFLILTFPSGQLTGRLDRVLLGIAVALTVVLQLVWLVLTPSRPVLCTNCPDNLLQIGGSETISNDLLALQRTAGIAAALFAVGLIVRRWRQASVAERRAAAPVLWSGCAILAALALSVTNDIFDKPLGIGPALLRAIVFAAFPLSVLAVMLRRRLARGAVARLVVELGEQARPHDLREALARTLGDPTLELAYWIPATGRYVDADGTPILLPDDDPRRAATLVRRGDEPIAALVHDPALSDDAELIDSVCAAAGLAHENERLQAALRSRLAELAASRARLVEAGENERRRLERDLHDGAQQRLVSIAMALGLVDARLQTDPGTAKPVLAEARQELTVALEELRRLSHGIRPSILTERGLGAALEDLASRSTLAVTLHLELDRRLPDHVESCAYFLVSESLANAGKHAHTREAAVRARIERDVLLVEVRDDGIGGAAFDRGSGLRGLTDRVEGLGGRLSVTSPPGRGTEIHAEIPCA
ncbi:MAG: sensor histidine kinase [Gaiellaceae bacterium]